jgi:aryl-alcohol dehydrogenase-like predicted oxidoreductase
VLDVAIGGLLAANPAICSMVAGTTKPEQARANAAAATWRPARDDLAELRAL